MPSRTDSYVYCIPDLGIFFNAPGRLPDTFRIHPWCADSFTRHKVKVTAGPEDTNLEPKNSPRTKTTSQTLRLNSEDTKNCVLFDDGVTCDEVSHMCEIKYSTTSM